MECQDKKIKLQIRLRIFLKRYLEAKYGPGLFPVISMIAKRDDNVEERNIYEILNHNIAYEIRLQPY